MAGLYDRLTGTPGGQDAETGAVALRNWLQRAPYRWIVVFDNAEPGTLDGIVPASGTGQVIITSRTSDWPGTTAHPVGALPPDEAAALLARITGLPASQDALALAAELGGLALAIDQAAAYIRQTRGSYTDYLHALRTDPRTAYDSNPAQAESVTARVWQRSLNHVTASAPGHPATAVLGVLSYLAPDEIPRQLLAPGTVRNAPVLGGLTPVQVSVALASLADYSLITLDTNAIAVHRVIQHLTRLDAEARDMAIPYCSTAISLLNPASNPIPAAGLLPHILDATARAQHLNAAPAATVRLLNSATFRLLDAGQVDTARPLLDRALDIAREVLGPDHPETLTARGNLAYWLGEAGQPAQAASQLRDLLTDDLRILGPDHPETLTTRGNLAYWLGVAGQPAQAAAQYRDLLSDDLRSWDPTTPRPSPHAAT